MLDFRNRLLPLPLQLPLAKGDNYSLTAYDAADVMDSYNFVTLLKCYVIILSIQVVKVYTKKVPALEYCILAMMIYLRKLLVGFGLPHCMEFAHLCINL